jgi:Methyltransferase domain
MAVLVCPLCKSQETQFWHEDKKRKYYRCGNCLMVFIPPSFYMSMNEERAKYEIHQNSPEDMGYRSFLSNLADPLLLKLPLGVNGLDYGCGPGPTLSVIFEENGFSMSLYDYFFAPDIEVFDRKYGFVTCSEVLEHCFAPMDDIQRMWNLLEPKGWLGIMTGLVTSLEDFKNWHYIREQTHVCFFSRTTFELIGEKLGATPIFIGKTVILFQKYS